MGKLIISMAMFNRYLSLSEGKSHKNPIKIPFSIAFCMFSQGGESEWPDPLCQNCQEFGIDASLLPNELLKAECRWTKLHQAFSALTN